MLLKRKILKVSFTPLLILGLISYISKLYNTSTIYESIKLSGEELVYNFPSLNESFYKAKDFSSSLLFFENDFLGFKEALAFRESGGNYKIVNKFGFIGKYQFGKGTLALVGVHDSKEFLNSPLLQEKAFIANLSRNKWVLRKYINDYAGKKISGILITESGILAAAHLAGPNSVKRFLDSEGLFKFKDAFGTSIKEYLKKFNSYDISEIPQNRKAKATQKKLLFI